MSGAERLEAVRPELDPAAMTKRLNRDDPVGAFPPEMLERWLVGQRLAERDARGRLRLTERGAKLGRGIE